MEIGVASGKDTLQISNVQESNEGIEDRAKDKIRGKQLTGNERKRKKELVAEIVRWAKQGGRNPACLCLYG